MGNILANIGEVIVGTVIGYTLAIGVAAAIVCYCQAKGKRVPKVLSIMVRDI